jgi:hypothetical protein
MWMNVVIRMGRRGGTVGEMIEKCELRRGLTKVVDEKGLD